MTGPNQHRSVSSCDAMLRDPATSDGSTRYPSETPNRLGVKTFELAAAGPLRNPVDGNTATGT